MSQKTPYPAISNFSLAVLVCAKKGVEITPATMDAAFARQSTFELSGVTFEEVIADLDKAHLIDGDRKLSQLGEVYARFWHQHLGIIADS